MSTYLNGLNHAQREAVETTEGPVLVLAGAGTGKTRVLTTRFAHILLTRRALPNQILSVTFTNKAAREMRGRIEVLIGGPADGLWLGTFHSLAARMLRRHADRVNRTAHFSILDPDDQLRTLKQVMEARHLDVKRFPPQGLIGKIQRWKDRGLMPDQVSQYEDLDWGATSARDLYAAYQDRLRALDAVDFGDLLLLTTDLLKRDPDVLAAYHRAFRYILVDEYQDTNTIQYYWMRLLAQAHKNVCCVGDDDQSIYSWRGAEIENILRFETDFPGAKIIRLEQNYRSTVPILAAAAHLISHNKSRLGKTLHSGHTETGGEKVEILSFWDSDEEARMIGDRIGILREQGEKLAECAVLVRAGFQTRAFEERFIQIGLPYRLIGGLRFYERAEIRDAIAYLRVLTRPADDLAFERIVNVPKRGIGDTALCRLRERASSDRVPLTEAASRVIMGGGVRGKARDSLRELLENFWNWKRVLREDGHVIAFSTILNESGYAAMWNENKSPDAAGRVENLKELGRALADFETLEGFLDHVSLVMENDEMAAGDRVALMTLHAAKGLEFSNVFLPGWEEGVFPNQRALDEGGAKALEEERRLAYVGITRARHRLIISHCANRRVYATWQSSTPSRFTEELPGEFCTSGGTALPKSEESLFVSSYFGDARVHVAHSITVGRHTSTSLRDSDDLSLGSRVFHQKFGYGIVRDVDGDRVTIDFDQAGEKRVLKSYIEQSR